MASPLIGPPELQDPDKVLRSMAMRGPRNAFMDLTVSNFRKTSKIGFSYTTKNDRDTVMYSWTGNACLDLFYHAVRNSPADKLHDKLRDAWIDDPLTTLKLICNLRGVRGTGKSDKQGFYTAVLWLHGSHPKTLACNLHSLANFGYLKDFPEILYRLLEGENVRRDQKSEWIQRKMGVKSYDSGRRAPFSAKRVKFSQPGSGRDSHSRHKKRLPAATKELRMAVAETSNQNEKAKASLERKQKKIAMANKSVERYYHDPDYRFLYERVSDLFVDYLKKDIEFLITGETNKISLAAKWCPSLDSSFDRVTLLCESIARKMFPKESDPSYEALEEAHYAYRVRDRLRKQVLVPLRKVLQLPEVYIGRNDWNSIPYDRVPSVAMRFYKEKFLRHDPERFQKYLDDVKSGEAKIASGALLPHEIIKSLNDDDAGKTAEVQWVRMVDDLIKKGKLKNCMAVSDVSSSMKGTPMEVSIALSLIVSELSEEPWKGKIITFSENPQLQCVEGDDLRTKVEFVKNMEWGSSAGFQKVFDLILGIAVDGKLKPAQMIKRLFVFSDMEFDKASSDDWETDHQAIVRKFKARGYGECIPEIVFWNLRGSKGAPTPGSEKGVALVGGSSKNLIKLFLENDGEFDPMSIMEAAIAGDEYEQLVVIEGK